MAAKMTPYRSKADMYGVRLGVLHEVKVHIDIPAKSRWDFFTTVNVQRVVGLFPVITLTASMHGDRIDMISTLVGTKIAPIQVVANVNTNLVFWAGSSYALRIGKPSVFDVTEGRIIIPHDPAL
jgi:hypothetical protein